MICSTVDHDMCARIIVQRAGRSTSHFGYIPYLSTREIPTRNLSTLSSKFVRKPASKSGPQSTMQLSHASMRLALTPHCVLGASNHCLSGRLIPDVLHPGIEEMRGSKVIRPTAMHDNEYTPLPRVRFSSTNGVDSCWEVPCFFVFFVRLVDS